jgi:monoamine oxidase
MRVGRAGGFGATFATMRALGLLPMGASAASRIDFPPNTGAGVKVAILGGGIAGLVTAYEMRKLGFRCTILEARHRPGGRNWTVRSGTKIEFVDGTKQTANWEPDSYLNAGPARLPSIHKTMLGYCHALGVPLEVEVNTSRSSLLECDQAFAGKPVEQRQAVNDTRGHIAELLTKCIHRHALDEELTPEDQERMVEFLRQYGDLGDDDKYHGSERAGATRMPGAGTEEEQLRQPLEMRALLDAGFWQGLLFEERLDMQATMFQPVGGMDRIPYAFAKELGDIIQYGAIITEIRKRAQGVRIVYSQTGTQKALHADYCVCALPLTILKTIPNDFDPSVKEAIDSVDYDDAYKIGWESKRFWETECNIYGGISWVMSGPVGVVWYPSAKLFSERGVVVAGYTVESYSGLSRVPDIPSKLAASRAAVERIHPSYGSWLSEPVYVNWGKIPFNLGSWVGRGRNFSPGMHSAYHDGPYKQLIQPDDRIYFAGDHCSHIIAWQEGAALSAHRAVNMIGERVRAERA